jgi:two-component system phosphate regulon sensor histidine kinase PhoR
MEKEQLETILREMAEAVIVLDDAYRILWCNLAACRAFELCERDVIGRPAQEVIRHQELLDLLSYPNDSECARYAQVSLIDGRTLNAHLNVISGVGYAVVMQDVTHLKELDRVKSEYVTTVSHDLRTPLTTVQGYVDLLQRAGSLNEQQEEFVACVQRSLSGINEFISELLDIGHIEAGFGLEMTETDLALIVVEAVDALRPQAEAKGQRVGVRLPVVLSPVMGNARRLSQVVDNLVGNAIKYTPRDGHIGVQVSEGENHIKLCVTDDGIGIPLADQAFVFDKFFRVDTPTTRDVPGTGLGLSIVKSVVEKHGGRVWVESTPRAGSTFTVLLPKR